MFIVNPIGTHTHTIILLHGRGSNGLEFASELLETQLADLSRPGKQLTFNKALPGLKWVFPSAQMIYSAAFQETMPQWFDIDSLTRPEEMSNTQLEDLARSMRTVGEVAEIEAKAVPSGRLFLGGISQGMVVALLAMINLDLEVGAFIGLSGWMPCGNMLGHEDCNVVLAKVNSFLALKGEGNVEQGHWRSTPIFLGHEKHDPVVDVEHGWRTYKLLQRLGANPEWHEYDSGDHWIQEPEEAQDIVRFLQRQMMK